MGQQQGRGDTEGQMETAGRTAALQIYCRNILPFGNLEDLIGTADELGRDIPAGFGDDPGSASQNSRPVTTFEQSRFAGGGKTSKLFGADRDTDSIAQTLEAISALFDLAVIAGAESHEAGTDENDGGRGAVCHLNFGVSR